MSAVALESPLQFVDRPRRDLRPFDDPAASSAETPAASADMQPWELHSELVLVCPELRRRSLELLPERDPDAFATRPQRPVPLPPPVLVEDELAPEPVGLGRHTLRRIGEVGRYGLTIVGAVFTLAMLAEFLAR
jgi:hypothetical protein